MSNRSLNGLSNVFVNTLNSGDGINIVSSSSTSQSTINVDISKQSANTTISDTDLFLLEDNSGNIRKITGANMKSELEQSTVVAPLSITGNAISIKGLSGFTANKYLKVNSGADAIEYADSTSFWSYSSPNLRPNNTADNVLIGTTSNTDSRKLIVDGLSEFKGQIYLKGGTGSVGYINFYDTNKSHHTTLLPQEDINANVTLPNLTDTLIGRITEDTLENKTLKLPKISDTSDNHNYIFAVSEIIADRTITLPLLGANDTFVFENHTQTLSNKTLTSPTITGTGSITANSLIVNNSLLIGTTSNARNEKLVVDGGSEIQGSVSIRGSSGADGTIFFYDDDKSNYTTLSTNPTTNNNTNLYLPTQSSGTNTLVAETITQTLQNKTMKFPFNILDGNNTHKYEIVPSVLGTDRNITLPVLNQDDTFVFATQVQSLTNKTITGTFTGSLTGNADTATKIASITNNNIVQLTATQTLSNKTLDGATFSSVPSFNATLRLNGGTNLPGIIDFYDIDGSHSIAIRSQDSLTENFNLTLPAITDTLVTKSTQDVFTNKTFDSNTQFNASIQLYDSTASAITTTFSSTSTGFNIDAATIDVDTNMKIRNSADQDEYIQIGDTFNINYDTMNIKQFLKIMNASNSNTYIQLGTDIFYSNCAKNGFKQDAVIGNDSYIDTIHFKFKDDMTLFQGNLRTNNGAILVGENGTTINLDCAVNHAPDSINSSSFFTCYFNFVQIGDVRQASTSSVSFNTTSDYRLKTDVEDFNDSLNLIKNLKVKKFKFISDKKVNIYQDHIGFIAHEMKSCSELFNTVVSGEKDEMGMYCKKCNKFYCSCGDDCGDMIMKEKYQVVDYSKLTPYCIGAIQELYAIIQQQQTVINNLINATSFKDFKTKQNI